MKGRGSRDIETAVPSSSSSSPLPRCPSYTILSLLPLYVTPSPFGFTSLSLFTHIGIVFPLILTPLSLPPRSRHTPHSHTPLIEAQHPSPFTQNFHFHFETHQTSRFKKRATNPRRCR